MKITFDSNAWRKVVSPNNFPKDPLIHHYRIINEAIQSGKIVAFLSETIFTLEAVQRHGRKDFFKDYLESFKYRNQSISFEKDTIVVTNTLGPSTNVQPENDHFLNEHFSDAKKLGFKILRAPRIVGPQNKDVLEAKYELNGEDLDQYLEKVFESLRKIEELQAGIYQIKHLGLKYDHKWLKGVATAPDSENGNIATAVAEWADGDSVASHIAIGGDYFCTNDQAKKAGTKSVLSSKNIEVLKNLYGFKTINPEELSQLLDSSI